MTDAQRIACEREAAKVMEYDHYVTYAEAWRIALALVGCDECEEAV